MRPGPPQLGAFLGQQAEELTRIWRIARHAERRDVFPGLLDGVVEPFLRAAADALEHGDAPEEAFQRTSGTLRWPLVGGAAELELEWALVDEVLHTTCESVNADPAGAEWLRRAVDAARAATAPGAELPRSVVRVLVFASAPPGARTP